MMLVGVIVEAREFVILKGTAVADEGAMTGEAGIVAVELETAEVGPVLNRELMKVITELVEVSRVEMVETRCETFEEAETWKVGVLVCDEVTEEMRPKWLALIVKGPVVLIVDKVEVETEIGVELLLLIDVEDVFDALVVTFRLDLTLLLCVILSVTVLVMT